PRARRRHAPRGGAGGRDRPGDVRRGPGRGDRGRDGPSLRGLGGQRRTGRGRPDGEDQVAEAATDAQETDEDAPEPSEDEASPATAPEEDAPPPAEEPRGPRSLETDALVQDLADRLFRLGVVVERDFGLS